MLLSAVRTISGADHTQNTETDTYGSTADNTTHDPLEPLRNSNEIINLENSLSAAKLERSLSNMLDRKSRLEVENALADLDFKAAIRILQQQAEKLSVQLDILSLSNKIEETMKSSAHNREISDLKEQLEKLRLENEIASAEYENRNKAMSQREHEIRFRQTELQLELAESSAVLSRLSDNIAIREKTDQWLARVNKEAAYLNQPLSNGILTISDRRITLNGVIGEAAADNISKRIDYFNNQNREYPIFIVIDRSPGGSVMAGYKILKAMEGSYAPVYVVVKSYAASMAAAITTLAKKSYAYPNAIILHHQILAFGYGNLTEQKEMLKDLEEWWKRLAKPISEKMGISLDEFISRMYKNRSSGDWREFADQAKTIRWVDEVVTSIREESYIKNPDLDKTEETPNNPLQEFIDSDSRRYVLLPRLDPVDCYYLYNPDNYYRLSR